jgi:hypothetical protein
MFIAILTLLSALSISGVAIFYSVIGLATIFPGAFVPVVIMGGVLEVGKLITASWLYRNWKFTPFMLRTYLTTAVIILSLITSMGIFGFLSKAHLEQNLASETLIQRIQILEDKIESEKMSIERQTLIINRAEKAISRDTGTASGEEGKNRDLNDRLKVLDKNVSDVLTSNKSFFNEEKAAAELKASQKEEREQIAIKVTEAQERISELKKDHKEEISKAQEIIANMRSGSQVNKGQFTKEIDNAEQKIFDAQGRIDLFIVEKQPLEKEMLTLEAEIGPVKYIAALAVDWGITDQVETSKAVRWVILLLIVVFDPLAVLLLIAANQSLLRRFPPEAPKPQEVIDLEKPDEEDVTLKWNEMMDKSDSVAKMEQATEQLKEWKEKLEKFNSKVETPKVKPVEIIREDPNDTDWGDGVVVPEKNVVDKPVAPTDPVVNPEWENTLSSDPKEPIKDGFDPDEVMFDLETTSTSDEDKQLEKFKKREEEEHKALEEYARKAREEQDLDDRRTKPDLTEVVENDSKIVMKPGTAKKKWVLKVEDTPPKPILSNWQRAELLDNFHKQHGNFEDVAEYVQNAEQNDKTLWQQANRYRKRLTSEEEYHQRVEARTDDLITKIENKEISLSDLSDEDRKVILDVLNQKDV